MFARANGAHESPCLEHGAGGRTVQEVVMRQWIAASIGALFLVAVFVSSSAPLQAADKTIAGTVACGQPRFHHHQREGRSGQAGGRHQDEGRRHGRRDQDGGNEEGQEDAADHRLGQDRRHASRSATTRRRSRQRKCGSRKPHPPPRSKERPWSAEPIRTPHSPASPAFSPRPARVADSPDFFPRDSVPIILAFGTLSPGRWITRGNSCHFYPGEALRSH